MLAPEVLLEIGDLRHQELLRERERDRLIAEARQSAPSLWRQMLAQSLYALAARIEPSSEPPSIAASTRGVTLA